MSTEFFTKLIEALPVDIENGPWIAGGFPLSVYRGDKDFTHDIDFFFKDQSQFDFYYNKMISDLIEKEDSIESFFGELTPIEIKEINVSKFESNNAVTFFTGSNVVQFIRKKFYNSIEEVLDDFDISVCKIATDGVEFFASDRTFDHIEKNIFNIDIPHNKSIKRFTKYVQYGFSPTKESIQAILELQTPITNFISESDY